MAATINHIDLIIWPQSQNSAQITGFMVFQRKPTLLVSTLQPAGVDQQTTSFRHDSVQPIPGKTLSG